MKREIITFRLDAAKKRALDAIAASTDRDRSFVLNEAISSYLETHEWQLEHIREGVREAEAGRFAKPSEVAAALAKWRK